MALKRVSLNLIWQPLLAIIFVCVILFFFNRLSQSNILWAVGAGALSSSCCIVFVRPTCVAAMPWNIVGGYLIGMVSGELMRLISVQFFRWAPLFLDNPYFQTLTVFAAISVGITLVVTAILKVEHPPAAGLALVLVLEVRDYTVLAVIFFAVLLLVLMRILLRKQLRDL